MTIEIKTVKDKIMFAILVVALVVLAEVLCEWYATFIVTELAKAIAAVPGFPVI